MESFDIGHKLGQLLAFSIESLEQPDPEDAARFDAGIGGIEEHAHRLDPIQAIAGFLFGLGSTHGVSCEPDTNKANIAEFPRRTAHAAEAVFTAAEYTREAFQKLASEQVEKKREGVSTLDRSKTFGRRFVRYL